MDLLQIGKFISELRKAQGLTQEQLGEKIGVTNKTVSRWETGTYLPPADAAILMLVLAHGWRNNAMMTYIERNAYDGTGKQ